MVRLKFPGGNNTFRQQYRVRKIIIFIKTAVILTIMCQCSTTTLVFAQKTDPLPLPKPPPPPITTPKNNFAVKIPGNQSYIRIPLLPDTVAGRVPRPNVSEISSSFTFSRAFKLNEIIVSFPLTGFSYRYGKRFSQPKNVDGGESFTTAQWLIRSRNEISRQNTISLKEDLFDFNIGYEAFLRLLTRRKDLYFRAQPNQMGPTSSQQLSTNRISKNLTATPQSSSLPVLLRDTCEPKEKFMTLMQDLIVSSNDKIPYSSSSGATASDTAASHDSYSLMISYENFWFCETSQIKFKGIQSNDKRVNALKLIRGNDTSTKVITVDQWAMLNGDCLSHEPVNDEEDRANADCNALYTNIPIGGNSVANLNPTGLPWVQFQNIAGTGEALLALLLYFKWSQVVIINDLSTSYDREMAVYIEDFLLKNDIAVNSRNEFSSITSVTSTLSSTSSNTKTNKTKSSTNTKNATTANTQSSDESLQETLQNLPSFIRCVIIIGDLFHHSIQDESIEILSQFVDNRKIVDNQGTPNKISILMLETEYTFRVNSLNLDYFPGRLRQPIPVDIKINESSKTSSESTKASTSKTADKTSFTLKHIHFLNSLFILTYLPFFGVTQQQYNVWFQDNIDKESLLLQLSKHDSALKVTRVPSFLFSAFDYINFQAMSPTEKRQVMNRVISEPTPEVDMNNISRLGNTSNIGQKPFEQLSNIIYEIKSNMIGYTRLSSEGLLMNPFFVLHFVDKLSAFRTVLYIEQDVENRSLLNSPKKMAFKVIQNNYSQYIEPLFFYKNLGKLICEEKYVKDLDGPAEELSVAFFSVLLCGILGFSIFFFIKKRMSFKQMFLGPHKIIILPSDLDFNNLSVTNFKSKLMDEGSKADNVGGEENKENLINSSGHLLKATSGPHLLTNSTPFVTSNPTLDKPHSTQPGETPEDHPVAVRAVSASSKIEGSIPVLGPHQGFQLARYMGDIVIIRPTPIRGSHIKSKTMRVLRMIRDLRHENINNLIGIYLKPEPPHSLVWEYCSRGSVEDIIKAENIKLDWQFKVSLLTDLAKGMRYIHSSPIRCHGNLKSRNCVIDSRWVLKVTGYGMTYLSEVEDFRIEKSIDDLLWVAPELLRDPILMAKGTQSGDIYSFAIIVQELIVRGPPFHSSTMTTEEILRKIQKPPPLIRPTVSKQDAPPQAIQLMKQCWAEQPNMRPDFNQILEQLKTTTQGRKTNIVDTMFRLLEKYSSNLEEIVQERTMQLEEERKKTEALLEKMLPKSVADSLKVGNPIHPESYNEVTIYFSDIVGFTTISAESTPFEVVDFLNDLYTTFDSTIQNYDAYKVETIGDAYMVVSGLPERNGERHAIEIATLSLDLLHNAGKFKIRHKPDVRLKLRIGLHTGPCAAGVVGLTMPRYCLFGDTVNTASRMESNGKPLRIHISWALRDKLEALGGFHIEYRGEIEIKGKGLLKTYWLNGKDGFDKSLPHISDLEDNK